MTKAYTIDVLEHLSPDGLQATLAEIARADAGRIALRLYTRASKSVLAPLLRLVAATASQSNGWAWLT